MSEKPNGLSTQEIQDKIKAEIEKDAELKKQYGYIRKVKNVDDNGIEHVAYFKSPNRLILGIALAEIEKNVTLACEYIFDDAIIKEISDVSYFRDNDNVFLGIIGMLQGLVQVKKSTITT
jgi:hypothetical protein